MQGGERPTGGSVGSRNRGGSFSARGGPGNRLRAVSGAFEGCGIMLSVVIATHNSERALLPTLAALVQGAAAGIVREVIVADAGSRDATTTMADGAGCGVLVSAQGRGARIKAGADAARASWLLFLRPGAVLDATWVDETRRFVEQAELQG